MAATPRLTPADAAVLGACDGVLRACDVAASLRGREGLEQDADVFAALERLVASRLVVWKLEVPIGPRPEPTHGRTPTLGEEPFPPPSRSILRVKV